MSSPATATEDEKGTVVSLALADELFLMVHDLQTGKARVPDPALGIGLSAALLGELMFSGSIVVQDGSVTLGEYAPPAERLCEALYEETRNRLYGQELTVREWLTAHRKLVQELVADRLIRSGDLRRDVSRRLGRNVVRYFPVKPAEAFLRAQRLPSYLRHQIEVSEPDVFVALLVRLMTHGSKAVELDATARAYLQQLVPRLHPSVSELLSLTDATISSAVRTRRR